MGRKGQQRHRCQAKDQYQLIKQNYEPINLPKEVVAELDAIVKRADEELGRKN